MYECVYLYVCVCILYVHVFMCVYMCVFMTETDGRGTLLFRTRWQALFLSTCVCCCVALLPACVCGVCVVFSCRSLRLPGLTLAT